MDIGKLISCVFDNRSLWNVRDINYHNREMSRQKWESIAREMNTTSEAVKNKWRGLRDTFRRELNKYTIKRPGKGRLPVKESTWPYFKNMEFLTHQFQKRKPNNSNPSLIDWEASEGDDTEKVDATDPEVDLPAINVLRLIEEVKNKPCLYDNRTPHSSQEMKLTAWNEIGTAIIVDWSEYSLTDKEAIIKDMQKKWKSVRNKFVRQLRVHDQVKAGNIVEPPRKYRYMDQLDFLNNFIQKRVFKENPIFPEDSNDSLFASEDPKPLCKVASIDSVQLDSQPVQFVPIQPKPNFNTTTTTNIIGLNALNMDDVESPLKKMARSVEELVNIQKEEKINDPMGNRKFLLSLLPFLRKLPDDVNLEVRLQLMSVLQTYTSRQGFQN